MQLLKAFIVALHLCALASLAAAEDVKTTEMYARIKARIDSVPAINTHDHLMPFSQIRHRNQTEKGEGMTLRSIWAGSYFQWIHPLEPWPEDGSLLTANRR